MQILSTLAKMIDDAKTVAIFGGEGCRDAREEVLALAERLMAPVGYSFRGKQWLEHDNPYAVGMTGLLGYGGAHSAINEADLLLLLGTDFPFSEFLPGDGVKKVQIDTNPKHIGRRTNVDLGLVGDVKTTVAALLGSVNDKTDRRFLDKHVAGTKSFDELLQHYVVKGPGIKPIRPEFLAATLSELASDDAMFFIDTGTACMWGQRHLQGGPQSQNLRVVLLGIDGQCRSQCVWGAACLSGTADDRTVRRWRIHDAGAGRPVDAGAAEVAGGTDHPEQ